MDADTSAAASSDNDDDLDEGGPGIGHNSRGAERRDEDISKRAGVHKQLLDLFSDVESGFQDQSERADDIQEIHQALRHAVLVTRQAQAAVAQTVRVNTDKLDSLMDVVGELVIVQSQLIETSRLNGGVGTGLQRNVAQLSRLTMWFFSHSALLGTISLLM